MKLINIFIGFDAVSATVYDGEEVKEITAPILKVEDGEQKEALRSLFFLFFTKEQAGGT